MKLSKKILAVVLAVLMMATAAVTFTSCGNKDTIKIGLTGPLTGGAAIYGIAVKNSAMLAIDEINAEGGLDGVMLELVMHDDKHDATTVENLYADLYEQGMQVSLGTVTTKPCLEFKNFAK